MRKMRVLIKRPDEQFGHICNISDRLENLQKTVGGYIETVTIAKTTDGKPIILVCNEEGKLQGLKHNIFLNSEDRLGVHYSEQIVGTFFLCSSDGEEFTDLPDTFGMPEWKELFNTGRVK